MKKEFVRNPYNYDSDALSDQTGLACKDESKTDQSFVEEADVNFIADRYMRTGMAPQVLDMPTPGDFTGTFDFQSSMNMILEAQQQFMTLPAKTRTRFNNDPQKLMEFINDDENYDEAVKLGFIDPDKQAAKRALQDPPTSLEPGRQGPQTDKPAGQPDKPAGNPTQTVGK